MDKILEVCVDSFASAKAAIEGGADRLELCSSLILGGLSPFTALLAQIREYSDIPIRCLMRPRFGDFLYTADEIDLMCRQIAELKDEGASGFVLGALQKDGSLDISALTALCNACGTLPRTLHRCIDVSRDISETYDSAAQLGFDTVLTSGGASNCILGQKEIGLLLEKQKAGGPTILVGAGVNHQVISEMLVLYPELCAFHMSGKVALESQMAFRRENVPMGLPGLDEWHIWQTDAEAIRLAKEILDK